MKRVWCRSTKNRYYFAEDSLFYYILGTSTFDNLLFESGTLSASPNQSHFYSTAFKMVCVLRHRSRRFVSLFAVIGCAWLFLFISNASNVHATGPCVDLATREASDWVMMDGHFVVMRLGESSVYNDMLFACQHSNLATCPHILAFASFRHNGMEKVLYDGTASPYVSNSFMVLHEPQSMDWMLAFQLPADFTQDNNGELIRGSVNQAPLVSLRLCHPHTVMHTLSNCLAAPETASIPLGALEGPLDFSRTWMRLDSQLLGRPALPQSCALSSCPQSFHGTYEEINQTMIEFHALFQDAVYVLGTPYKGVNGDVQFNSSVVTVTPLPLPIELGGAADQHPVAVLNTVRQCPTLNPTGYNLHIQFHNQCWRFERHPLDRALLLVQGTRLVMEDSTIVQAALQGCLGQGAQSGCPTHFNATRVIRNQPPAVLPSHRVRYVYQRAATNEWVILLDDASPVIGYGAGAVFLSSVEFCMNNEHEFNGTHLTDVGAPPSCTPDHEETLQETTMHTPTNPVELIHTPGHIGVVEVIGDLLPVNDFFPCSQGTCPVIHTIEIDDNGTPRNLSVHLVHTGQTGKLESAMPIDFGNSPLLVTRVHATRYCTLGEAYVHHSDLLQSAKSSTEEDDEFPLGLVIASSVIGGIVVLGGISFGLYKLCKKQGYVEV